MSARHADTDLVGVNGLQALYRLAPFYDLQGGGAVFIGPLGHYAAVISALGKTHAATSYHVDSDVQGKLDLSTGASGLGDAVMLTSQQVHIGFVDLVDAQQADGGQNLSYPPPLNAQRSAQVGQKIGSIDDPDHVDW